MIGFCERFLNLKKALSIHFSMEIMLHLLACLLIFLKYHYFSVTEALVDVGTSMYEDNQTAFAMRSLGVAAVLASADGPLPFGDALAVTVLVGAGVYGLGDSFGWW